MHIKMGVSLIIHINKQTKNSGQLPLEWWFGFSAMPYFSCQPRCNLMVSTHLPVKLYISPQNTNMPYPLPLYIQPTPQACILFSANHGIRMRPVFRMVLHVCMLILRGKEGKEWKPIEAGGKRRGKEEKVPGVCAGAPRQTSAEVLGSRF